MSAPRPVILILGPTAGGKTSLAIDLAQRLPGGGECLSADSMQVYRGMDIGTAKPTPEEQAAAPHHLIDIADPKEDGFTVDTWLQLANQAIEDIRGRGAWPLVVGGTNLYVQALLEGLFDGPEPDPELRGRLQALAPVALRAKLLEVDPKAAERIHLNDIKRTIRAIEVFELTGAPLSEMQQQWHQQHHREDVMIIGLQYQPETINPRINARVKAMIDAGFVNEVATLRQRGALGRQASEALGYRQILEALEGNGDLDEAIEQIKIKTRRFAKHQRTWLRRFQRHPCAHWIAADELHPQIIAKQALEAIAFRSSAE